MITVLIDGKSIRRRARHCQWNQHAGYWYAYIIYQNCEVLVHGQGRKPKQWAPFCVK